MRRRFAGRRSRGSGLPHSNRLSVTEGTVKRHLRNIFGKLGAVSRIDAVNKYNALADGSGAASSGSPAGPR
ncbi:helix-turn-helix transcriptional regulator [Microbispora sp. NPDC046933]|uniref:helix-turn-helix domain-containing protein n=1 Tax=Microbispora sp. NPDC046933 TaxID=3155618 RepID=UPI0033C0E873